VRADDDRVRRVTERGTPLADLMQGAALQVKVDLNLKLGTETDFDGLPSELAGEFARAHAPLIDWLRRDAHNRKLFVADPIAALTRAGITFTPRAQEWLKAQLGRQDRQDLLPDGVEIRSFTVELADERPDQHKGKKTRRE
jgi:hypothetical protein